LEELFNESAEGFPETFAKGTKFRRPLFCFQ
jgi:hypothetical protein